MITQSVGDYLLKNESDLYLPVKPGEVIKDVDDDE